MNLPALALFLNLDLILAGFGRGRRKILLFPDEIVLKGHSVDVASSSSSSSCVIGISVLGARKFHHCGSSLVVPSVSGDDDPFDPATGLAPFDAAV